MFHTEYSADIERNGDGKKQCVHDIGWGRGQILTWVWVGMGIKSCPHVTLWLKCVSKICTVTVRI